MIRLFEDPDDYRVFEQTVTADYDADIAVGRELVLLLASLSWRLRRTTSIETGLLQVQTEMRTEPSPPPANPSAQDCEVIAVFQSGQEIKGLK